jgi:hypothetical protein
MLRKTILFSLLFYFATLPIQAQINVGSIQRTQKDPGKIEAKDLEKLKSMPTIFVLRPGDMGMADQYQKMLDEVWTFNKVKVMVRDGLSDLTSLGDYAFIGLEGHATVVQMKTTSYTVSHYYLHLSMRGDEIPYTDKELKKLKKKGKRPNKRYEVKTFARMSLYPDGELLLLADDFRNKFSLTDDEKNEHMDFVYNEANFYNYEIGLIKNQLQEVNRCLEAGELRWIFETDQSDKRLKVLKREKIYVPDHILIRFNKFNGNEDKRHEASELFADYEGKYEIIPAAELSDMIMNATEPFYYFNYIRSSTDAFYTVVNGLTGEIIYSEYDPVTYNIKPKNIKALAKSISKVK